MSDFREINQYWYSSDIYTVKQAAALIAGYDPHSVDTGGDYFRDIETNLTRSDGISDVKTVFICLVNAINARKLRAMLQYDTEPRFTAGIDNLYQRGYWGGEDVVETIDGGSKEAFVITKTPNWDKTTIDRADLVTWLESRGMRPAFFFPTDTGEPDYLDPKHPRYASELSIAVKAWQAVSTTEGKGKPKARIMAWLNKTYGDELSGDAKKRICTVANWEKLGGATKTK